MKFVEFKSIVIIILVIIMTICVLRIFPNKQKSIMDDYMEGLMDARNDYKKGIKESEKEINILKSHLKCPYNINNDDNGDNVPCNNGNDDGGDDDYKILTEIQKRKKALDTIKDIVLKYTLRITEYQFDKENFDKKKEQISEKSNENDDIYKIFVTNFSKEFKDLIKSIKQFMIPAVSDLPKIIIYLSIYITVRFIIEFMNKIKTPYPELNQFLFYLTGLLNLVGSIYCLFGGNGTPLFSFYLLDSLLIKK